MNELIAKQSNVWSHNRRLLCTVSVFALLTTIQTFDAANAQDETRPTVWIEIGSDLERQTGQGDPFNLPFMSNNPDSTAFQPVSPLSAQQAPSYSFGGEAKLIVEPSGSDWSFSAGVRYGRANGEKHIRQLADRQTLHVRVPKSAYQTVQPPAYSITPTNVNLFNSHVASSESHMIVDFAAGHDVGLGLFGNDSKSVVSFGVRFAQFSSKMSSTMHAIPNLRHHKTDLSQLFGSPVYIYKSIFHSYGAHPSNTRSFRGIGPALSWDSSVPLLGNNRDTTVSLDLGANASVLFGRQRVSGTHQSGGQYHGQYFSYYNTPYVAHSTPFKRSRSVVIPNVGGFAGISLGLGTAKVSLGYRGDFFFGAMDTGNETRKTKTVGFYGPFATVSVGLGG